MKKTLTLLCLALCAFALGGCQKISTLDGSVFSRFGYHSAILNEDVYYTLTFTKYGTDNSDVMIYSAVGNAPLSGNLIGIQNYYVYRLDGSTISLWQYSPTESEHKGKVSTPYYVIDENTLKTIVMFSDGTSTTYTFTRAQ
ncbi:MAG: hypothetical protein LKK19_00975 [Bacteroidales bacterium]|jgi:hypothetical protein|nr:hypothetical protein [Bacteroidales bacterium]MCI2121259.1 hypothetical protein [Bacteroidales bacterium]MCI2146145.1 hypothetical protein [Bacteroidales bacterium]